MTHFTVTPKQLVQTEVAPVATQLDADGTLFLDFGKAAFGTLLISLPFDWQSRTLIVHLGEKLTDGGRIDRQPYGTVRYLRIAQEAVAEQALCRLVIPSDPRNTRPAAILMPDYIGEVYPFRYAEIEAAEAIDADAVRQLYAHYPFDDGAASFHSSDDLLNAIWELCRYSIKATTFCGVYVDGDRERIPYEGDAYVNQLSHYCVDAEYALARYTHEYLLHYPTWPTEWQMYSVMMAWEDYLFTGETESLATFYPLLRAKSLIGLAREDGLVSTQSELCTEEFERTLNLYHERFGFKHGLEDLVDWPPGSFTQGGQGERDGHEMLPVNTVVNAFHYHALVLLAKIADVLGNSAEFNRFTQQAALVKTTFNELLFDPARGVYIDGEGATHASLHSNMFALAFGLVPADRRASVLAFVKSRGMACSVFNAQFLLEALYKQGEADAAMALMVAQHDRSWWHMLASGSTMTWEAWDWKYKNNLDWNHAWGTAPVSIIPRYVMGIRPLEAGFGRILIQPQPSSLTHAKLTFPSPRGSITVAFEHIPQQTFTLTVSIPADVTARIELPLFGQPTAVTVNERSVKCEVEGNFVVVEDLSSGHHIITASLN